MVGWNKDTISTPIPSVGRGRKVRVSNKYLMEKFGPMKEISVNVKYS